MVVKRFEVWLVQLDPAIGSEIKKTRPCVVISPNEINAMMNCIMAAPMTSTIKPYPFRVSTIFKGKKGQIALDQIRSIDKMRMVKRLGSLTEAEGRIVSSLLVDLFSYE